MPFELTVDIQEEIFHTIKRAFYDFALFDSLVSDILKKVIGDTNRREIDMRSTKKITESYYDTNLFKTDKQKIALTQISLILRTTYVLILSYYPHTQALKWASIDQLLEKFPEFADQSQEELGYLLTFRNFLRIALEIIPARLNKQLLLKIAGHLEGSGKEYITGSGQKPCVTRRVYIYQREGSINPEKREARVRLPRVPGQKRKRPQSQPTTKELQTLSLEPQELEGLKKLEQDELKQQNKLRKHDGHPVKHQKNSSNMDHFNDESCNGSTATSSANSFHPSYSMSNDDHQHPYYIQTNHPPVNYYSSSNTTTACNSLIGSPIHQKNATYGNNQSTAILSDLDRQNSPDMIEVVCYSGDSTDDYHPNNSKNDNKRPKLKKENGQRMPSFKESAESAQLEIITDQHLMMNNSANTSHTNYQYIPSPVNALPPPLAPSQPIVYVNNIVPFTNYHPPQPQAQASPVYITSNTTTVIMGAPPTTKNMPHYYPHYPSNNPSINNHHATEPNHTINTAAATTTATRYQESPAAVAFQGVSATQLIQAINHQKSFYLNNNTGGHATHNSSLASIGELLNHSTSSTFDSLLDSICKSTSFAKSSISMDDLTTEDFQILLHDYLPENMQIGSKSSEVSGHLMKNIHSTDSTSMIPPLRELSDFSFKLVESESNFTIDLTATTTTTKTTTTTTATANTMNSHGVKPRVSITIMSMQQSDSDCQQSATNSTTNHTNTTNNSNTHAPHPMVRQLSALFPPILSKEHSQLLDRLYELECKQQFHTQYHQEIENANTNVVITLNGDGFEYFEEDDPLNPFQLMKSISWEVYSGSFSEDLSRIFAKSDSSEMKN